MALDIISTINLDLKRPNTETVYAVQYDTAGRIKAQLTNDGEAWHVPSSAGGMVSFRKSDNIGGFYDTTELGEVAVSVDEDDDSIIYIALDAQTTITATPLDHPVQMQINFYNSQGKRLSTFAFYLRVQASVLYDGDQDERPVASEWTFRILTGALGQTIKNQEEAIKWMEDNIRTQAGYVVDDTLKVEGAAGDAKKIGELFEEIVKISDSMPGYFPTTDTERVGNTKYYTRSGTSPNYVYTEYTGATFATGVTYYEYSPWNRIWIDPDDNDIAIPTMDEIDELTSALSAIESLSGKTVYERFAPWTIGRAEAGNNNPIPWCCYSKTLPVDYNKQFYFDDSKYKVVLSFFNSASDETAAAMGAWITSSPFVVPTTGRPYFKINVALVASSGNIDTTDVDSTTYIISEEDALIVDSVRTLNTSVRTLNTIVPELENSVNGWVLFGTDGSIRGQIESIDGLTYIKVVDLTYQICLYYLNSNNVEVNTAWGAEFDLTNYKSPTKIMIRRADNGAMPAGSANRSCIGRYADNPASYGYVLQQSQTVYVNTETGDDSNDGLNPGAPFLTIQEAIDRGYKHILVKEGTYTGGINLDNKHGVTIAIDHQYSTFDASTANNSPKVVIDCNGTLRQGVKLYKCSNIRIEGIEVKRPTNSAFIADYCENVVFSDCVAHDVPSGNGWELNNVDADFINCGCYNIGTMDGGAHHDGFNLHRTGVTNFKNCWAHHCEDDGISHHDACVGFVDGGEWHNCGKGGICTPTHGAKVDVSNAYVHDCGYGIYAGNDTASLAKTFNISGCVCKNNTIFDIYVNNNTANIWNCIYDTISHAGVGDNNILA